MAGAQDVAQLTALVTPLVVAALCLFAKHRGFGGRYLLFWAAANLALAATYALVAVAPTEPRLDDLPAAWSLAQGTLLFCNLAILFGVVDIETERVGLANGLLIAGGLAVALTFVSRTGSTVFVYGVLPGSYLPLLAAGTLLLLRRRSFAYMLAGGILMIRAGNGLQFVFAVHQTGILEVPAHTWPLSILANFLIGISLLLIAIDDAWRRLGEILSETRAAKAVSDTIVKVAPVSIIQKDRDLRIVSANPYAMDLVSRLSPQHESVLNLSSLEMTPGEPSRKGEEVDRRLLEDPAGGPQEYEVRYVAADGSPVTLLVRKAALVDDDGAVFGTISVSSDISELKRSEARLREAAERAEQANRVKTDFLANMSHELRTPLNGINGFAEMLGAGYVGALNDRQKDYVESILTSSRAMLGLVSDILDLSKMTTGRLELCREPLDVAEVAHTIAAAATRAADAQSVSLHVEVPPLTVEADRRALLQSLGGLVDNAIRFNRPGGTVRISASRDDDGTTRIAVADTGIGMTGTQIEATGDPFLRGDSLKAREGGGSGLGLAVARGFVELHGGSLAIESRPGSGSTVTIRI